VISLLPEVLREFSEYRYLLFGVLLVVVMVFRPQGLWPPHASEAERVKAKLEKDAIRNGLNR
jgi:branched-chain amino acid transport system permease protein